MDRMDAMKLFVAAVDAGSLSGAARQCAVSLSSVSRHLSALEERIGARLMVRTTRALVLTDAGRRYCDKARRVLAEIDDLEAGLLAEADEPAGRLYVLGPTLFGRVFMLPLLARFAVMHPKVSLDVMLLDSQVNLVEEGVDFAIRIGPMRDSSLIVRKLGALRWVVCAAPSYLSSRGVPRTPADLSGHDCLVYSQDRNTSEWELLDGRRPASIQVPVRMRSNTLDGVVAAAVEGAGLVCGPAWSMAEHVERGRLRIVLESHAPPPRAINAVFTHNRLLSGKVRALADYLAGEFAGMDFNRAPPFAAADQPPAKKRR